MKKGKNWEMRRWWRDDFFEKRKQRRIIYNRDRRVKGTEDLRAAWRIKTASRRKDTGGRYFCCCFYHVCWFYFMLFRLHFPCCFFCLIEWSSFFSFFFLFIFSLFISITYVGLSLLGYFSIIIFFPFSVIFFFFLVA